MLKRMMSKGGYVLNAKRHLYQDPGWGCIDHLCIHDRIVKTSKVKGRWNEEEDLILVRAIWKDNEISYIALSSLHLGRSVEAVKKKKETKGNHQFGCIIW